MIIYDANGLRWTFDKNEQRLYCIEAEEEMRANGTLFFEGTNQNGEYCRSWTEAIIMLNDDGYMEK